MNLNNQKAQQLYYNHFSNERIIKRQLPYFEIAAI